MVTTSLGASHFMSLDTDIITVIDLLNTVRINKNQPKKKKWYPKLGKVTREWKCQMTVSGKADVVIELKVAIFQ